MDIRIHSSFLPHTDPDASVAFYRDPSGSRCAATSSTRVALGDRRPHGQLDISIVLEPPAEDPGITDHERDLIIEMRAKGTYSGILLATDDLDATFASLQAEGAEIVPEPIEQGWGVRDCAVRDPAGNMIRIQESR